ncbi:MAG TPA: hypothetical protein VMQ54_10570 [Steroidobacteraceae bacterium]|nr:hypothetical protein [Steroidobacteraceae bacterium]
MKSSAAGILFALIAFAAMIASTATSFAQELSIGSETISASGVATVALDISGLTPGTTALSTFDVNVGFNSSVVNFASAAYGDPILGDQLNFNGLAFQATAPGVGTTELFELSLDDPSTLLSSQPASFTLATLTFDAVGTGTSALGLSVNALGDQNGNSLSATLQNGSITVTGAAGQVPEIDASSAAGALTLLLGGLLVSRGRRI